MIEIIIAIVGIVVSVVMYQKGRKEGKKEKHEDYIISQIDKIVDQYNEWDRSAYDNGIHALTRLGLEALEDDENIKKAILKIEITSGKNPFGKQKDILKDVNLFILFKYIRENNINVLKTDLVSIIKRINQDKS